jgi:cell wall-associated NlpC family hydrolase
MKKFIAISALALVMIGGSEPGAAAPRTSAVVHTSVNSLDSVPTIGGYTSVAMINHIADVKRMAVLQSNTAKLNTVISQLKGRVHKTWYVFSGDTPSGWDCSGMTMWAYGQLGFNLEHRASKQKYEGTLVKTPKVGDIVAFTYKGSKSAYHVGIYLGPDKMIHAGGKRGEYTSIVSISKFAGKYSTVTYTRFIDTI